MDSLLQIKKTTIEVGLKKAYRFLQISDIHMACVDEHSSQQDIEENIRFHKQWDKMKRDFAKTAGELCDERYDVEPNVLFEALTNYAKEIKADALIMSGDVFDRITETNLRYLESFLKEYPLPVIFCPGNHCWKDIDGTTKNMYDRLKPVMKNPEFDYIDFGEFAIVTVDDGLKQITDNQLSCLKQAIDSGKKILLVVHAPLNLGEFGEEYVNKLSPYFFLGAKGDCENAFEFNRIVSKNEDSFIAVLAGHIHAFAEGKIGKSLMQYTTSSGLIGACREIIIK